VKRHLILVGLPGAGKTTVGKLLAERLQTQRVDIDALIVRRMQMPITRVFGEVGEATFRALEAEFMAKTLAEAPAVVVPGGGWAAQPNAIELAKQNGFLIYLRALARTAAQRATIDEGRPLLMTGDPLEGMQRLLKEREPFYLQANHEINTEGKSAERIADELAIVARREAGW
jgi:shikimate kinase